MFSLLRVTTVFLAAGALVAGCGGSAGDILPTPTGAAATLAPTPLPTALPNGWARVVMIDFGTLDGTGGTTDPKTGLLSGVTVTWSGATFSDPRVNGTLTEVANYQPDSTGTYQYIWGTATLVTAGGSWVGTCRGFISDGTGESVMSCWLAGRAGYEGFTYTFAFNSFNTTGSSTNDTFAGLIYRGSPPAP